MTQGSFDRLRDYKQKSSHLLIGIMSGTSLDGVDAALVRIDTEQDAIRKVAMEGFQYVPFSDEIRTKLIALCAVGTARLDALVAAHYGVSEWYAHAVKLLLASTGVSAAEVDAICMHGQTVWHAPKEQEFPGPLGSLSVKSTLQIGEPAVVRERMGIPVISNLRAADLAAGGEGAPLAPYLDRILFGNPVEGVIVQNIGGIGNATVIPAGDDGGEVIAFDTGPGNMIIDALVRTGTGGKRHFDEEGAIAAAGRVSEELLRLFYDADPYFKRLPPKSTGREVYGAEFTERFQAEAERRKLSMEDTVATATAFTAMTIVKAYEDFVFPRARIGEVILSGGGAHNRTLRSMIKQRLPQSVKLTTTTQYGVPDDAREAVAFAVLGHESLMGRPSNLPSVTGAKHAAVLGQITL